MTRPILIIIRARPKNGLPVMNVKIVLINFRRNIARPPKIKYQASCFFSIIKFKFSYKIIPSELLVYVLSL